MSLIHQKRALLPLARGLAALAVLTWICLYFALPFSSTGYVFLVAIVLNSLDAGWQTALITCIAAVAILDYYFVPPLRQFPVSNLRDVIRLGAFILTALVITRLSTYAREQAGRAQRQQQNLALLYALAQRFLALDVDSQDVVTPLVQVFAMRTVCLYDAHRDALLFAGDEDPVLSGLTRRAFLEAAEVTESDYVIRCLWVGPELIGAVAFRDLLDRDSLAGPLAALTAAVLNRKTRALQIP